MADGGVGAKELVHQITNKMQSILGYIELGAYDKAKREVLEATELLVALDKMLKALTTMLEKL